MAPFEDTHYLRIRTCNSYGRILSTGLWSNFHRLPLGNALQ